MTGSGGPNTKNDAATTGDSTGAVAYPPISTTDPRVPLLNLSALNDRMESVRRFLSDSVERGLPISDDHLQLVSSEISAAVHHTILNAAALLASSALPRINGPDPSPPPPPPAPVPPSTASVVAKDDIVELDEAELMAEHVHFCEICGKGFKRDANLRMHMRAHGDRFKTLEALSRPDRIGSGPVSSSSSTGVKFSCPFPGCNRNRAHRRFRPLKSAVCVRNHFKRSHCPKMYCCHRCNKKSFAVVADLRSHLKHCGESPWRCSCGTTFSRKDKLFGHLALFEGHKPAVGGGEERRKVEGNGDGDGEAKGDGFNDAEFFEGLMEEFVGIEKGNWSGT
ncbi:uncharacterized protein [Typha angustifolia]|uniref:uncharacterized protein n=1 Tax=Typha angustifolia TaxID=59011 RepID=UPI003C30B6FF